MSRFWSAINSAGRNPVAAANRIIGPYRRPDRRRDCLELRPRLERMLLFPTPDGVVDADLGQVDVDHPPRDRSMEDLAEGLGSLEAVARREPHPPSGDLLRCQ